MRRYKSIIIKLTFFLLHAATSSGRRGQNMPRGASKTSSQLSFCGLYGLCFSFSNIGPITEFCGAPKMKKLLSSQLLLRSATRSNSH